MSRILQLDSLEKALQLCQTQWRLDRSALLGNKLTLLETFAPNRVAGAIKIENLHLRLSPVNKHITVTAQWIFVEAVTDKGG